MSSVAKNLSQSGCEIHLAAESRETLQLAMELIPEVVVLSHDLGHSKILEITQAMLRNFSDKDAPAVLIMPQIVRPDSEDPAHDSRLAESLALDLLAQSVRTLTYRVKHSDEDAAIMETHGIKLDTRLAQVELDGQVIELTRTEFRILQALLSKPGHVYSRTKLEDFAGLPSKPKEAIAEGSRTRRIDVHVKSIRSKLGTKGVVIETVRGIGYRLRESAWNVKPNN